MVYELLLHLNLMESFEAAKGSTFLAMTDEAVMYLANWGINLTSIHPELARGILKYHLLEGVHTSTDPLLRKDTQLAHSVLRPPVLTNITGGPVVKLTAGDKLHPMYVESGIQKVLPIIDADISYDVGVIHTINQNLVLPHNLSETTNLGGLHRFWNLVERSQTGELLEGLRDVTVLLPSDKAVDNLLPSLDLLDPEGLAAIIKDHAIPDRVLYHTAFSRVPKDVVTLSGRTVQITRGPDGRMFVNDAMVTVPDVLIYGGVAHVLDGVLPPPAGIISLSIHVHGGTQLMQRVDTDKYPFKEHILAILRIVMPCWRQAVPGALGGAFAASACLMFVAKYLCSRKARALYPAFNNQMGNGKALGSSG